MFVDFLLVNNLCYILFWDENSWYSCVVNFAGGDAPIITDTSGYKHLRTSDRHCSFSAIWCGSDNRDNTSDHTFFLAGGDACAHQTGHCLYKQFVPNCPQARRLRPQYFFSLVRPGDRTSLRALFLCSFSAFFFVSFSSRFRVVFEIDGWRVAFWDVKHITAHTYTKSVDLELLIRKSRPSHYPFSQINNQKPTRIWRPNAPLQTSAIWYKPYR